MGQQDETKNENLDFYFELISICKVKHPYELKGLRDEEIDDLKYERNREKKLTSPRASFVN